MPEKVMPEAVDSVSPAKQDSLRELAGVFLRLGTVSFGGPAAHVAMVETELVRRRKWLTPEKFLDLLGAGNLIPGPSSSELAIYIGYLRAGWVGLLIAGICFILPAAYIVGALSWAYVRFGKLPAPTAILYGIKPAVIAVILQALWELGRTAIKIKFLAAAGLASLGLAVIGLPPLVLLVIAGAVVAANQILRTMRGDKRLPSFPGHSPSAHLGKDYACHGNSDRSGSGGSI